MKIRLSGPITKDSIVDGEGIRAVIWTQGCPHNCPGCHNPSTHDFKGGYLEEVSKLKKEIEELQNTDGLTFSGGEPMEQAKELLVLAKHAKKLGLNLWSYTGYRFEELLKMAQEDENLLELLKTIDVLVEGRFIMALRTMGASFRGSSNQRVLDSKASVEEAYPVELEKYLPKKPQPKKETEQIYF